MVLYWVPGLGGTALGNDLASPSLPIESGMELSHGHRPGYGLGDLHSMGHGIFPEG